MLSSYRNKNTGFSKKKKTFINAFQRDVCATSFILFRLPRSMKKKAVTTVPSPNGVGDDIQACIGSSVDYKSIGMRHV